MSDDPPSVSRSRPASVTVSPPMRCLASASGGRAGEQLANVVDQRPDRRCTPRRRARSAAAGPRRWPPASRRAGRGGGTPPRRARASAPRTGRARAGPARPTARRRRAARRGSWGQPLQAQVRSMDHHLAQLADLGVHAELGHRHPFRCSVASCQVAATTLVPAVPATIASMSSSAPMAARLPGRLDEADRRGDLRAHRAGGERLGRAARRR